MSKFILKTIKILPAFLLLLPVTLKATDWSCVANLSGSWYFSVGDDLQWANPKTDVSGWDKIYVPGEWEEYYKGYNGYGWYRRDFDIRSFPKDEENLTLLLGQIDDVDEVFVNGVKVGQSGGFFPDYQSAYDVDRQYTLPKGLLKSTNNTIAVRVYDEGNQGGIVSGNKIGIYYDFDNTLLSLNLSGDWKFATYREPDAQDINFDDSRWKTIKVPSSWESQGYANYDGYGYYRKEFTLPQALKDDDLYLSLGRIDDADKVYFNGKMIGRTEDLESYNHFSRSNAYRMFRIYRIPSNLIKTNNVIVVEVRDIQQRGGIYEGPIGIVNRKNAHILQEQNEDEYWPNSIESVFHSIFNW